MAGYFDGTGSSTTLEDLNRALILLQLMPARSLAGISMESDSGLVLNHLRSVQRQVNSKGWWFNTDRRISLSPDESSEITIENAVKAHRSRPRPGEDCSPEVRLSVAEGSTDGKLWNRDEDSFEFEDEVMVDIVRNLDLDNVPQEFRDYCVYKTVRELAPVFGVAFDATLERESMLELERIDADNMEDFNLLENDPQVLSTWYR